MAADEPTHTLYHFSWSICSIMARYTFAMRGQPKDPKHEIRLKEEEVNIYRREQLAEHYLLDINPLGEVPALEVHEPHRAIPDSQEITKYFAESYPSLIPEPHADQVKQLMARLHDINFFTLSFTGQPQGPQANRDFIEKQLDGQISARYREILENKIKRLDTTKLSALGPEVVKANEDKATKLMEELEESLNKSKSGWCLGLEQPSALDAHLVVFIARMCDVDRANLIPQRLLEYAKVAKEGKEWKEVMQDRNTFRPRPSS